METRSYSTVHMIAMAFAVLGAVHLAAESVHAQVIRPLTDLKTDGSAGGAIDDAGSIVFALSRTDPFGSNPLHAMQVVQWSVPGGPASQVGNFRRGATDVSVTDDGAWLAVVSRSNPAGQNNDLSSELFLVSADGQTIVQLTDDPAGLDAGSVISAKISGSGNRVLFGADTDPLGTNPDRLVQLFIIDADGTDLTQLTSTTVSVAPNELGAFDLSDDGSRIVFAHSGDLTAQNSDGSSEIFSVLFDGTQLFQHTALSLNSEDPVISGDGSRIAFSREDAEILTMRPGPLAPVLLGPGREPSITDDGQFVYYIDDASGENVFMIPTTGGPATQLTFTAGSKSTPIVSGANTRIVFSSGFSSFRQIMVMDANGSNLQQLTANLVSGREGDVYPDVTPDGNRIVFASSQALTGPGTTGIYRVQADGSDLTLVTNMAWLRVNPSISSDGTLIAFQTELGLNCNLTNIFRISADGTGLLLLTPDTGSCGSHHYPQISGDGSFVVFQGWGSPLNGGLHRVPIDGGAFSVIVEDGHSGIKFPRLSGNDEWVAYQSGTDFDGLNPGGQIQAFRARTDGTLVERLTADSTFDSIGPDIDADGDRIAYLSEADPLGTNPDHNAEVFLYDAATMTTQQLTVTTSGSSISGCVSLQRPCGPKISGNGEFVYFVSTTPFFETPSAERFDLYRVTVATGQIERASGLRNTAEGVLWTFWEDNPNFAVDSTGRAVISDGMLPTGGGTFARDGGLIATNLNFDQNGQLWWVDFDAPARIHPGKQAPTLVSWDVEPDPVRYDVIRGDVANLRPGGSGEVDLGQVVCIEDDSPDNDTMGSEDALQPAPGQVLFYVHRGTPGMLAGPGSYDLASDGSVRVPAFGDCQP